MILYPNENSEGASNEQRSGYTLNLQRLQQQLSQLEVLDLNSNEMGYLGFQSRDAAGVLIFTLSKYVDEAKNTFDSPGFGLTLEESKYRTLLLLSLLSLGFTPVGADQELPICLEQLQNTSKELYKEEKNAPKPALDTRSLMGTEVKVRSGGLPLPKYGQKSFIGGHLPAAMRRDAGESRVDGTLPETTNNADLWDSTNPKSQEALLKMAKNITAMTSSLFLR